MTSSTCHTDSEGTDSALSLLQHLRSPLPSELARKRAIKTNPPVGAKRGTPKRGTPKTVSVGDRLKAYPEENFVSSNNRLFCSTCRDVVVLKKSVIELHISSQKHKHGKEQFGTNVAREKSICESLKAYDVVVHPVGENLPDEVRIRRVKVVQILLKAGIPLAKADCLRELLEEDSTTLTSASNLSQLLPFILHEEMAKFKSEVQGQPISINFDGTTHMCEAMVIVLHFIDDQWSI